MGNSSTLITAGIGGVIAIIIALVTFPILQSAADTYYLEYVDHCEVGSESFLRTYTPGEDVGDLDELIVSIEEDDTAGECINNLSSYDEDDVADNATKTGDIGGWSWSVVACDEGGVADAECAASEVSDSVEWRSEHGKDVGTLTVTREDNGAANNADDQDDIRVTVSWDGGNDDAEWSEPHDVLAVYAGISTLVLSILPILAVTGFLGISASNIYDYVRGGTMGIQGVVVKSIAALIVTIVGLYLAPTIMNFLEDAYATSTDNRFGIMSQFGTIIRLVFGFVPVVYNAGLLAMFAYQGVNAYKNVRGGGGGGGGGM